MAGRARPPVTYPKSKAIASITTALSAVIFKIPDGRLKEILLVLIGLIAYFAYHGFVIVKRFVLREGTRWVSLKITELRARKYLRELEIEFQCPETTPERLIEIRFETKRYRDALALKRLESLD
jgi:hypothetical protein